MDRRAPLHGPGNPPQSPPHIPSSPARHRTRPACRDRRLATINTHGSAMAASYTTPADVTHARSAAGRTNKRHRAELPRPATAGWGGGDQPRASRSQPFDPNRDGPRSVPTGGTPPRGAAGRSPHRQRGRYVRRVALTGLPPPERSHGSSMSALIAWRQAGHVGTTVAVAVLDEVQQPWHILVGRREPETTPAPRRRRPSRAEHPQVAVDGG
jgi:hypothetical protein